MGLKHSYTLLSPIYDLVVSAPTEKVRAESLQRLANFPGQQILINGIGSGLDIPFLPSGPVYTGTDLTPAMLSRAHKRARDHQLEINLQIADTMDLPFDNNSFDHVVMHLILAVVPQPDKALSEACRVLKPGGRIYILDKFLQPDQRALLRRIINPFIRHIATRTDVVFEHLHQQCHDLKLIENRPVLLNGWFRSIELQKEQN